MAKTLTLGELASIETITGHDWGDQNQPKGKWMAATVMVLMKRTNPDFKLDDAYAMDVSDAEKVITDYFGDDADPLDEANI